MAYSGTIRFILEEKKEAVVQETESGASDPTAHKKLNANFSAKSVGNTISYNYNSPSDFNDGNDITIL